jgi:hypothetical protein
VSSDDGVCEVVQRITERDEFFQHVATCEICQPIWLEFEREVERTRPEVERLLRELGADG